MSYVQQLKVLEAQRLDPVGIYVASKVIYYEDQDRAELLTNLILAVYHLCSSVELDELIAYVLSLHLVEISTDSRFVEGILASYEKDRYPDTSD